VYDDGSSVPLAHEPLEIDHDDFGDTREGSPKEEPHPALCAARRDARADRRRWPPKIRPATASAPQINEGVVRVIQNAPGKAADGLDDPRLRDLCETVRRFMAASEAGGTTGRATARLAALLLGVTAKDARHVELVAGLSPAALRARLRGGPQPVLPRSLDALLDQTAATWTDLSDADFWQVMAAAAVRPDGMSPERHVREWAACLGVVAELGRADVGPRLVWATAAEKADLVDVLITAGTGATEPVQAVMDRVRTLTRGPDRLPRAIAAELARMALAALDGVVKAPPPDRRGAVLLRERPPRPDAMPREVAAHQAREALRGAAHSLVALDDGNPDQLSAHLFRARLSTLYLDMGEQLRQYAPRSDDDLPGEKRYRRLLEVLGPLDRALVEALDRWSAALATGSTDPQAYVDVAREAESAIKGVLRQMSLAADADDPGRPLFPAGSPEQVRVALAVRKVAIELGLEAGEVLLGQVAPPGDPMAGPRQRLAELREDQKRLRSERDARMRGPLLATVALRPKYIGALDGPTVKALTAAATAFDTAAATSADPGALEAAADHLIDVAEQARTAGARLRESDRQDVVQLADLLQALVAERLERWPGPLGALAAALRATIPTLPLPATGESLDRFWSEQKTEVLATLPSEIAAQVSDAMSLHLGAELGRLTALAPGDAAATEEQAWRVIRILRAYKATAARLPVTRADAKARLHAVLDAVALSVQRLLSPPSDGR
jgi:hypothetical protein